MPVEMTITFIYIESGGNVSARFRNFLSKNTIMNDNIEEYH